MFSVLSFSGLSALHADDFFRTHPPIPAGNVKALETLSNAMHRARADVDRSKRAPDAVALEPSALQPGLFSVLAPIYPNASNLVTTNVLRSLTFQWSRDTPADKVSKDHFTLVAEGYFLAPTSGVHTFHAESDDGLRLRIGDRWVIDDWLVRGPRRQTGSVLLTNGFYYPIRIEYFEREDMAKMELALSLGEDSGRDRVALTDGLLFHAPRAAAPSPILPPYTSFSVEPRYKSGIGSTLSRTLGGPGGGPPDGMVLHLPLDEVAGSVASEATGSGAYGNLVGGSWAKGYFGGGLTFSSGSPSLIVANDTSAQDYPSAISIWFKPSANPSATVPIFARNYPPYNLALQHLANGKVEFKTDLFNYVTFQFSACSVVSPSSLALGTWHHLTATIDRTTRTLSLYVNGSAPVTATYPGDPIVQIDAGVTWVIGKDPDVSGSFALGTFDDARLYSRVLTSAEISDLKNSKGIIGHYTFEGESSTTALDSSGWKHHGAATAGSAKILPGLRSATAIQFSTSQINLPSNVSLNSLENRDYTVSAWIKANNLPPGVGQFYAGLVATTDPISGLLLDWQGKLRGYHAYAILSTDILTSAATLSANQWYHVALVKSTADLKQTIYLNGAFDSQGTISSSTYDNGATPWKFGRAWTSSFTYPFDGQLDHVRIYNRVLSATEIQDLYLDTDQDGLSDSWEITHFGDVAVDPGSDPDGDGRTNEQEESLSSSPTDFYNGAAPTFSKVSGDTQAGLPGAVLALPLKVEVRRVSPNEPLRNAPVTFSSATAKLSAQPAGGLWTGSLGTRTGADGRAAVWVQLPTSAGGLTIAANAGSASALSFSATVQDPASSQVAQPTFAPGPGVYATTRTVTLASPTAGATIRYTLDGSTPTASSTLYSGPITVDRRVRLSARAFKSGLVDSLVARGNYSVTGKTAAGDDGSAVMTYAGTVFAWGRDSISQFTQVPLPAPAVDIVAGNNHFLALLSDGTVWGWGNNGDGQLAASSPGSASITSPIRLGTFSDATGIAAGNDFTVILRSGGVVQSCGANGSGRLGIGSTVSPQKTLQTVSFASTVTNVVAGPAHCAALSNDGKTWVWGENGYYELGLADTNNRLSPTEHTGLSNRRMLSLAPNSSYALFANQVASSWGYNGAFHQVFLGYATDAGWVQVPTLIPGLVNVRTVSAGSRFGFAICNTHDLYCWGYRPVPPTTGAPLGTGALTDDNLAPILQPKGFLVAEDVSGRYERHVLAVHPANGQVYGTGESDELGHGLSTDQTTFVPLIHSTAGPLYLAKAPHDMHADPDLDTLPTWREIDLGTDPNAADSNGDGIPDGVAAASGIGVESTDSDADGLSNADELSLGTNPLIGDSDSDGVSDGTDAFPLDPLRWQPPPTAGDTTAPCITLEFPTGTSTGGVSCP